MFWALSFENTSALHTVCVRYFTLFLVRLKHISQVDRFINGESLDDLPKLCSELGCLSMIRTVERRIEARHKQVSNIFKRASAAGLGSPKLIG